MDHNVDLEKPDNREFCEQMAKAIDGLGVEEALSCMARMMIGVAHHHGDDIKFNCDQGCVLVKRKFIADSIKN